MSEPASIGRALLLVLSPCLAALVLTVCGRTAPVPTTDWPLACSSFPPVGDAVPECARRDSSGEIVLRQGALDIISATDSPAAVLVEDELFYALDSGKTAPVLPFDNGPDDFVEGLARTTCNGKIGFVNKGLELVVPCEWDFAFPFQEGVARVCTGCSPRRLVGDEHSEVVGGVWGYVDSKGEVVVPVTYSRDALPEPL